MGESKVQGRENEKQRLGGVGSASSHLGRSGDTEITIPVKKGQKTLQGPEKKAAKLIAIA